VPWEEGRREKVDGILNNLIDKDKQVVFMLRRPGPVFRIKDITKGQETI
jgi:hypothetical protein